MLSGLKERSGRIMSRPRKQRPALTQSAITKAAPAEKDGFLWDGIEHGLGVKITPAGSKVFILQKSVNGRLKRITLGRFGDISLDDARREARKLNGLIAARRDPVEEAKAAREEATRRARLEKTVLELWDRYSADVVAAENKPRTAAQKRRMWERRIKPSIGKLKVKDITSQEVSEIIRSPLKLDSEGHVIGGRAEAGSLAILSPGR